MSLINFLFRASHVSIFIDHESMSNLCSSRRSSIYSSMGDMNAFSTVVLRSPEFAIRIVSSDTGPISPPGRSTSITAWLSIDVVVNAVAMHASIGAWVVSATSMIKFLMSGNSSSASRILVLWVSLCMIVLGLCSNVVNPATAFEPFMY